MPVKYKTVEENLKDINTRQHKKEVEKRYNDNPKFWDKVYLKHQKKVDKMEKEKEKKAKVKS